MSSIALKVEVNPEEFRQFVEDAVAEVFQELGRSPVGVDGRLAYTEPEAAMLLGINHNQLRDARLRGEITGTKVGGRIGYERSELVEYLRRGRREVAV